MRRRRRAPSSLRRALLFASGALLGFLLAAPVAAAQSVESEYTAEEALERARDLLADEELASAEDGLRYALERWPEHHDLLVLAGWAATWSGRPAVGVKDFLAAQRLAPDSLDAWDGLAYAWSAMGRARKARQALVRAQSLDRDRRSREERALRIRWVGGDNLGAHVDARRLVEQSGSSELTESIQAAPLGFEARAWSSLSFRQEAPLARIGGEVRFRPHRLVRLSVLSEGSTWLGDAEFRLGGAAQLTIPKGFSLVVHGALGLPGIREPQGEVGVGLGWRIARIVEIEAGWSLRRWVTGTVLHLLRLGALVDLPSGTLVGATGYLGLVRSSVDLLVRPAPGVRIQARQLVMDPITVEASYALGTEIIVQPISRTEAALLTHELRLGLRVELTARLGFSAGYSLAAWSGRPPFHGFNSEFRALW
ncbi:MAG: hypothetical protein KDA24_25970 [Deltaproteobacteria bacterium]|nr:hypothetical protein [Deltaproteobacteria bacterium]